MIRRAENRDIPGIMDLLLQVLTVHHNIRPDYFKPNCRKYTEDELKEIIADNTRPIFVYDDNCVKGYCFCILQETKDSNTLRDMKTLYIDDLCVDENARGQRVGKQLYDYTKDYAKQIGCDNLTLNVWEGNDSARAFYDRQGLKPLKTTMEVKL